MKILILASGVSVHTQRWVNGLVDEGFEIVLFSLTCFEKIKYNSLVKIYNAQLDVSDGGKIWNNKIKYLKTIPCLRRVIKKERPDIVHAHYASSYGLLGALSGFHPYIISVWGSDVYEFPNQSVFHKKILKYNLSVADSILSTSGVMACETKKYTNKSIEITPFGVDIDLFRNDFSFKNNIEYIIGNVKALDSKYGIDILINAFKIVVDLNPDRILKLEIVGDGPDYEMLQKLCVDLNLSDKVTFIGRIENSKLSTYYNRFLVSVSLSNMESFGVVAIEAMACECPVVTSDADGFTEVVIDGETGFIVPKKDAIATAKAIQKFINNKELRSQMGKKGRQHVERSYSWTGSIRKMIDIYNRILD